MSTSHFSKTHCVCSSCGKKWNSISAFSDSLCRECRNLKAEQDQKIQEAMWKSYCPFCHMLLAEHKQIEAQVCLFNLRGYLTKEADGQ